MPPPVVVYVVAAIAGIATVYAFKEVCMSTIHRLLSRMNETRALTRPSFRSLVSRLIIIAITMSIDNFIPHAVHL
ncbi:hypothetical protein PAXRUDRAFT_823245 [Paxillus rubicundulus Ve08.2h10]|uniref:Uncharacterized protein n=1 Tax=Paxillus rubicundulus Ve08.2h10 TaxID=930991 RepID=A0A0D0DKL7_9AGAM|nr:hypothetical protein PAXRUDRAFT_823245 [Paxillus rubicundulus Ve08.2h10]